MNLKSNEKAKIACISVMQSWGGGEEFLSNLCENLHDYNFIVISPEGGAERRFRKAGIKTVVNNFQKKIYRNSGWNLLTALNIAARLFFSTFRLSALFILEKPDLILANGLFAVLYALPASCLTRSKIILIQHLVFDSDSVERRILKLTYRFMEKIVCVSETVKQNLQKLIGEDTRQQITVIPNGVKMADNIVTDKIGETIRIGMAGSIIRIKGIHLVITSVSELLKSGKAVLKIYGTTTAEKDSVRYKYELKELIRNYNIGEYVSFEGQVLSRNQLYAGIDILVSYSTIAESFSFSVLEAMSYGKIVVAANLGGPAELIEAGKSGFLVEKQNPDKLKEIIEYCVSRIKSESFAIIRNQAAERVKNYFSIEKFAENYRSLFHKILNSN